MPADPSPREPRSYVIDTPGLAEGYVPPSASLSPSRTLTAGASARLRAVAEHLDDPSARTFREVADWLDDEDEHPRAVAVRAALERAAWQVDAMRAAGAQPAPTEPPLAARVAALLRRCEEIDRTTWYANGDPSGGGHIATREVWETLRPDSWPVTRSGTTSGSSTKGSGAVADPSPRDQAPHPRIWWDGRDFAYLLPGPLLGQDGYDEVRKPGFYRARKAEDVGEDWVELRAVAVSSAALALIDDLLQPWNTGRPAHPSRPAVEARLVDRAEVDGWNARRAALARAQPAPTEHVAAEAPGVLHMAIRYALGRATYAVSEVVDAIRQHGHALPPAVRERMAAEIEEALAEGRAGMDCDQREWRRAVELLRAPEVPAPTDPEETR